MITNRPSVSSFHITDPFAAPSPPAPSSILRPSSSLPVIYSAQCHPLFRNLLMLRVADHSRPPFTARPHHLLMLRVTSSSCVASSVRPFCAFPLSTGALLRCSVSSVLLLPINFYRPASLLLYFYRSTVHDSASLMITNPKLPL
jgi:hypothetical protein